METEQNRDKFILIARNRLIHTYNILSRFQLRARCPGPLAPRIIAHLKKKNRLATFVLIFVKGVVMV